MTQKQVLELYITVIERKTLYSLHVPHTAFANETRLQLKQQQKKHTQKGPCYQDRNRDLAYNLVKKCWATGFYPTIKEN